MVKTIALAAITAVAPTEQRLFTLSGTEVAVVQTQPDVVPGAFPLIQVVQAVAEAVVPQYPQLKEEVQAVQVVDGNPYPVVQISTPVSCEVEA